MAASTYQVIALAIYFVAMIAIGLWANSKNNSLDDYVLGGRQLSPTVAALSAGASDMSGWLLMGLPGAVYLSGLSQAWLAVGLTIGAWCNWKFVAPRLRSYTEVAGDAVTVPVFLSNRLHDTKRVLRIVSGIVILVFLSDGNLTPDGFPGMSLAARTYVLDSEGEAVWLAGMSRRGLSRSGTERRSSAELDRIWDWAVARGYTRETGTPARS